MDAIWNFMVFIFSTPDPSVLRADPVTAILAITAVVSSGYQVNRSMHNERIQERAARDQRADAQHREDQLTNEAKAKAAATEQMKTAGQRAGLGSMYGFGSGGGGQMFASMFRPAPSRPVEDNIGRGSLFGN